MNLIQNLVDEVKWRYLIGKIDKINAETVTEVAEEIYPYFGDNTSNDFITDIDLDGLVFEALMRL